MTATRLENLSIVEYLETVSRLTQKIHCCVSEQHVQLRHDFVGVSLALPLQGEIMNVSDDLSRENLQYYLLLKYQNCTCVRVLSGQKTIFSLGMNTLAPANKAPHTVMTVSI